MPEVVEAINGLEVAVRESAAVIAFVMTIMLVIMNHWLKKD